MPIVALSTLEQFAAVNLQSDPGHIPGKKQVPQCVEVRIQWALGDGKKANNILHGRYVGANPATPGLAVALKSAFTTGATWTAWALRMPPAAALELVGVRDLNVADQVEYLSGTTLVPGTGTTPQMPDEVAFVVSLKTAKAGPANRGRVYLGALNQGCLFTGGVMLAAAVTDAVAFVTTNLQGGMSSNNLTLCIAQVARAAYGPGTPPQHPARPAQTVDVTSVVARNNTFDTIRRRGLK